MPALLLLTGLTLTILAQIALSIVAFGRHPLKGLACLFVPLYVYVFARRADVSPWYMRAWWLGMGLWIAGGVIAS